MLKEVEYFEPEPGWLKKELDAATWEATRLSRTEAICGRLEDVLVKARTLVEWYVPKRVRDSLLEELDDALKAYRQSKETPNA